MIHENRPKYPIISFIVNTILSIMDSNDCLNCDFITCIKPLNDRGEFEGGEFHVLKQSTDKKKLFFCQLEIPLQSCCLLISAILEHSEKNEVDPFIYLAIQILYDLRTSVFLAITAHYRGAMQLIRPIVETILVGIYFKIRIERAEPEEIKDLANDFDKWTKDIFRIPASEYQGVTGIPAKEEMRLDFRFTKSWLIKNKCISGRDNQRLESLEGMLNKYIHSYFASMDIGNPNCSTCPSLCRYNETQYAEWLDVFQDLIEILIRRLLQDYFIVLKLGETMPTDTADVTDDINSILSNLIVLEQCEKSSNIQLIKSKHLRNFISKIKLNLDD
jgi:hypothetical protein